tara:strand:+ start:1040 stop:1159 length:120 start_codon:yes stop_codon:yes gene_type:complete
VFDVDDSSLKKRKREKEMLWLEMMDSGTCKNVDVGIEKK